MPPTFTAADEAIYPITFGPDPRVYTVQSGSIAVTEDGVELSFKRPLLLWMVDSSVSVPVMRVVFPLYLVIVVTVVLCLVKAMESPLWFVLPLLLPLSPFSLLPIIPMRFTLAKAAVTQLIRAGREITLLAPGMHPFNGITFRVNTLEEARAIEEAMSRADGSLPKVAFTNKQLLFQHYRDDRGPIYGEGSVRITPDAIQLCGSSGLGSSRNSFLAFFVILSVLSAASVAGSMSVPNHDPEHWGMGLGLLLLVFSPPLAGLLSWRFQRKKHTESFTVEFPLANVAGVDHVGKNFLFTAPLSGGKPKWWCFSPCREEDADALEAALLAPDEDGQAVTFPVRFGRHHLYSAFNSFFGRGHLLIEGSKVTISGKHGGSGPRDSVRWMMSALIYIALVCVTYFTYPIVLQPFLTTEFKGIMVLTLPLVLVLALMCTILPLVPLFVLQSRTVATYDLRDLRRLGRQVTFTAPDGAGGVERYTFHLKTAEGAEAVARGLAPG